jgi:hypothetical protein
LTLFVLAPAMASAGSFAFASIFREAGTSPHRPRP